MRRLLVLLLLLAVPAAPAHAESIADVARGLESSPVYESPGVDLLDERALEPELQGTSPSLYVAALPARAVTSDANARERAIKIGEALGESSAVVLVISANRHFGAATGNAADGRGVDGTAALRAERSELKGFSKPELTAFVKDYRDRLESQVEAGTASGSSTESGDSDGGPGGTSLFLILAGLIGGGVLLAKLSSRKKKARLNEGHRAEVEQLYHRLGSDVSLLDPGDDPVARQAMADASERYNACGSALAMADSPAEFGAARRTAVEGLTAARVARGRLGLDLGPDIPLPTASGPQLEQDEELELGGQRFEGSPQYRPGRQHYYEGGNVGGRMVPGGWYSAPFWEPFILGSLLTGAFGGGGLFGGGHDSGGFERGYEAGQDAAADDGDFGGSDNWGGGGDFGGGDFGGGGDSGGGGGGDW